MNIYSKLLLGAAVFSLAACSNEEPLVGGEETPQEVIKPSGDVAYLNVRLQSADGTGSRAEGDYLYGDKAEQAVENAYFYFYDEEGHFVLESNSWLGGTSNGNGTQTSDYIEFKGKTTVVLKGLEGKSYPNWVVTVLNKPKDFQPAATLAEMEQVLIDSYSNGDKDKDGNETNFTMTTSSFFGGVNAANASDYTYFATKLKATDFKEEGKNNNDATIVDIYVERLAARVGVRVDLGEDNPVLEGVTYNGKPLYELVVSLAGENNPNLGDESNTAASKVYIAILGWELNSTAKQTHLMKNLNGWKLGDAIGNNTSTNTIWWNNSGHHRSFWGKSAVYGKSGDDLTGSLKANNYAWDELTKAVSTGRFIGDRVYCNETTNLPGNIVKTLSNGTDEVFAQYTPSVVLSAVVCDEKGEALELVRYQGVEYLKESFIRTVLNRTNQADTNQNYYIRTQRADAPEGVYDYTQIDVKDVKLASAGAGLGSVNVVVANNDIEYFTNLKDTTIVDTDNNIKYYTHNADKVDFAKVNERLAKPTAGNNKAIAKTNGAMFYTIPLTHLNTPAGDAIVEGQYGLVRNHVYDLAITKIKSLGDGVFKPHKEGDEYEPINPEEPKDPTYYVESAINILSWKIVSQQVEI